MSSTMLSLGCRDVKDLPAQCGRIYYWGVLARTPLVRVRSQEWPLEIKRLCVESFAEVENPVICKVRKWLGHPHCLGHPPSSVSATHWLLLDQLRPA